MKIEIRKSKEGVESVIIEGYVNAVDRFSRPLADGVIGRFIEKILPNVFKKAIQRAKNIDVYLNHDESRKLASTSEGTATIVEDNVGLRATVEITDKEVIDSARAGKLRGWSFGFSDPEDDQSTNKDGLIERVIKALTLHEVSIIDDKALPAYIGTSIEARSINDVSVEIRAGSDTEIDTNDTSDSGKDNKQNPDTQEVTKDPDLKADTGEEIRKDELYREQKIRESGIN